MTEDSERLRRLIETVRQARAQAEGRPFRIRVLLDMTLLELEKEAAQVLPAAPPRDGDRPPSGWP